MIYNKSQYNQGVGKYNILSSNAGVGSIIPTKWGGFIMPLSVSNWNSIIAFSNEVQNLNENFNIQTICEKYAVKLVDDKRFVNYLRDNEFLTNLKYLIEVPHVNLDGYNNCNYKNHPLFEKWSKLNVKGSSELQYNYLNRFGDYITIPAIVFPRWFRSSKSLFMPIHEWYDKWKSTSGERNDFNLYPQEILKVQKISSIEMAVKFMIHLIK